MTNKHQIINNISCSTIFPQKFSSRTNGGRKLGKNNDNLTRQLIHVHLETTTTTILWSTCVSRYRYPS